MATGAAPSGALSAECAAFARDCEAAGYKGALAKAVAAGASAADGDSRSQTMLSELQESPVQWYQMLAIVAAGRQGVDALPYLTRLARTPSKPRLCYAALRTYAVVLRKNWTETRWGVFRDMLRDLPRTRVIWLLKALMRDRRRRAAVALGVRAMALERLEAFPGEHEREHPIQLLRVAAAGLPAESVEDLKGKVHEEVFVAAFAASHRHSAAVIAFLTEQWEALPQPGVDEAHPVPVWRNETQYPQQYGRRHCNAYTAGGAWGVQSRRTPPDTPAEARARESAVHRCNELVEWTTTYAKALVANCCKDEVLTLLRAAATRHVAASHGKRVYRRGIAQAVCRRYPEGGFAVLRDALLAQGPAGHNGNAPACTLSWPPLLEVRAALAKLPDDAMLEWLLLYGEHGVSIVPALKHVSPRRCQALYAAMRETYNRLLALTTFPAAPPWPQADKAAGGTAEARGAVPDGVPRTWLSIALADGPIRHVCSVPPLTHAHPETDEARRKRLEDPAEREPGVVEHRFDGKSIRLLADPMLEHVSEAISTAEAIRLFDTFPSLNYMDALFDPYAMHLPWERLLEEVQPQLRDKESTMRARGLQTLCRAAARRESLHVPVLRLVLQRRNEQPLVRHKVYRALKEATFRSAEALALVEEIAQHECQARDASSESRDAAVDMVVAPGHERTWREALPRVKWALGALTRLCGVGQGASEVADHLGYHDSPKQHIRSRVMFAVTAGAIDITAVRALLDALLASRQGWGQHAGLSLAASLMRRCPSRAGFAADAMESHLARVRTPHSSFIEDYDKALRALARLRPAWPHAHGAALIARNARFLHVPAVSRALLQHDTAALLPFLTGATAVPHSHRIDDPEVGPRILAASTPLLTRLPPPQQAAVAAHCARVLREPTPTQGTYEAREARREALAQLVALPDAPLEQLRAVMAADAQDTATRDAVINALHAHPAIESLLPELRAALADGRSNAAIITLTAHLARLPVPQQLQELERLLAVPGARVGALKRVVDAYGVLYEHPHREPAARAALLRIARDPERHRDVRAAALEAAAAVDAADGELRDLVLSFLPRGGQGDGTLLRTEDDATALRLACVRVGTEDALKRWRSARPVARAEEPWTAAEVLAAAEGAAPYLREMCVAVVRSKDSMALRTLQYDWYAVRGRCSLVQKRQGGDRVKHGEYRIDALPAAVATAPEAGMLLSTLQEELMRCADEGARAASRQDQLDALLATLPQGIQGYAALRKRAQMDARGETEAAGDTSLGGGGDADEYDGSMDVLEEDEGTAGGDDEDEDIDDDEIGEDDGMPDSE